MAENKKSVIMYTDVWHTVKHLDDEQAGKLFKHFLAYVNDENPETNDPITKIAFEPIKQQLKRDLEKWDTIKESRSAAGKKSAELRKKKKEQEATKSTSVESVQQTPTNPTVNDNVNVNVNVNDTVIKRKKDKSKDLLIGLGFEGIEKFDELNSLLNEWIAVKKKKRASVSDEQLAKQMKKLYQFGNGNIEKMIVILEKSVNSGWADVFPLKDEPISKQSFQSRMETAAINADETLRILKQNETR